MLTVGQPKLERLVIERVQGYGKHDSGMTQGENREKAGNTGRKQA